MAVEAPFHLQRLFLPHQRHAVHLSVARGASHAFVHVNAVVEVDEVRQIVHARPLNRAACAEAFAHRFEERAVREDLRVAVHARLGGRNPREPGVFDGGMAVAAVDAVACDVAFVAELNRLFARDPRLGHPRGAVHFGEQAEEGGDEEHGAEDADPGNRVGAAMEDLRHRSVRRTDLIL